jgi:hypothetical protein
MINKIKELGTYEEQVQCITTPTTLMSSQQCKKAHWALIRFHTSMISNGITTDIDLPQTTTNTILGIIKR